MARKSLFGLNKMAGNSVKKPGVPFAVQILQIARHQKGQSENTKLTCSEDIAVFKAHGFSLIELMIVVTIIGVLCSIAIPAYSDYVARGKLTSMLAIAQGTKLAVTEGLITGTDPIIDKIANKDAVKEISVDKNVITILGDAKKLGINLGDKQPKIILTADQETPGLVFWKCTVDPAELKRYAPPECRG